MKRRSIVVVLCLMLMMVFVGCGKEVAVENPAPPTSEVVSEEVSEPVSEPISEEVVSEEVSEITTEEVSEVVSEEPSKVEMDLSLYTSDDMKRAVDLIHDMNYNELKIVVWGFFDEETHGAKAILSDGDSYTISEDDTLWLYYPGTIVDVQTEKEYIGISVREQDYRFGVIPTQVDQTENIEVPITTIAADGTEDTITIYVTIE